MALTSLSLFSGVAGLDLAVDLAFGPVRTVGYVERDPYAAAVILARMEDQTLGPAPVWCGEVEGLDPRPFRGVDLVTAGINCQPWSCAGQRKGVEDERWIWPEVERVLRLVGPRYLVLECTPGLVAGGLELILADLANLGFDAEWGLLPASAVGAPQRRLRFFLVAHAVRAGGPALTGCLRSHEGGDEIWSSLNGDQPDGGVEDVADAYDHRREGLGWEPRDDRYARDHADGQGGSVLGHPHGGGGERWCPPRQSRQAGPPPGHRLLADANGSRWGPRQPEDGAGESDLAGFGIFPPGPDDLSAWQGVLRADPTLEPSLRRDPAGTPGGVDGYHDPARKDRLRALGNAVCPVAGAAALRLLAERGGLTCA